MSASAAACFSVFVGLGANLGDAPATLKSAVQALRQLRNSRLTAVSSLYRSAPLGPPGQPDYFNAVARLDTALPPHALLSALQAIENTHGRVRGQHWAARTLDLDLLLYGNDSISTLDLILPHPELTKRNFVVMPLLELQADLQLPDALRLASLPAAHDASGLEVVSGKQWSD